MKRSKNVELILMLAASAGLAGCDNIDDRSQVVQDQRNLYDQKKPKVTCTKPEDFSLPECHNPQNAPGNQRSHSTFVYIPHMYGGYYGPNTPAASNYSASRSSIGSSTNSYSAPTVSRGGFGATGRGFAATAAVGE